MKQYFLLLTLLILVFLGGCTPKYDYTIHKPKIKYSKPSRKALAMTLKEKLGSEYIWAEEGPRAFDCSGLTYYSYGRMNMEIPRVSREQAKVGKSVALSELQYGDLIFFDTTKHKTGKITHVGIYIGDGKFQHASSSTEGVIITDIQKPYYKKRVVACKRYLPDDPSATPATQTPMQIPAHSMPTQPFQVAQNIPTTISPVTSNTVQDSTIAQGSYYIQVGTFANAPSQGLLQQIKSNGYQHKIIQIPRNGKNLNRVLIGPYASKLSANQSLDGVRATILPDAFAVEI